jgi:hypothetical protein
LQYQGWKSLLSIQEPFSLPPTEFFSTFPHAGKAFQSLKGELLQSAMPDKSALWRKTQSRSRDRKTFLVWGTKNVFFQGPEDFSGMGKGRDI